MASAEQQPDKKQKNQQEKKQAAPTQRRSSFLGWFFVILLIIAAAAIGGSYYLYQANQTLLNRIQDNASQDTQLNKSLNELQNAQEKLKTQVDEHTTSIAALFLHENGDDQAATLAEIRHLVYLASLSLYWQKDVDSAMALLKLADQKIQASADPNFTALRNQLAGDITALQTAPKVDVNGLLGQLNGISEQIAKLEPPLTLPTTAQTTLDTAAPDTAEVKDSGWRQAWHNSLDALQKIIVIQHRGTSTFTPLTDPLQQHYVVQTIQIALQQARLAVLQRNQALYTDSIQQAIDWLNKYFSQADAKRLVALLQPLQKTSIAPQLPDLTNTLTLIDRMTQQQKPQ